MRPLLLIIIVVIIAAIFLYSDPHRSISTVCFDLTCVDVEIVDAPIERIQGLMNRDSLEEGKGMLFIFENETNTPFWMKNMKFPIDIIWISNGNVVHVERNVPPCERSPCPLYRSNRTSTHVLEVNANFAQENYIQNGSSVRFVY